MKGRITYGSRRRRSHLRHPDGLGLVCGADIVTATLAPDAAAATCKICVDYAQRHPEAFGAAL